MSFYVYLHRKRTNGEVFYVGKGKDKRAWSSFGRNELWKRTADKYGWYVEIVEKDLQSWYAFELEQDLIALYGRRDLGHGTLTNMSDGGDGPSNLSKEAIEKIKLANKGLKCYKADHNIYKLYNVETKEIFEGKRVEFENQFGIKIGRLFTKKATNNYIHMGWTRIDKLPEDFDLSLLKPRSMVGDKNANSDKTVYTFFNIHSLEKFVGTRNELRETHGVNTGTLFYTGTSYKGWAVFNNQSEEELDKLRNPTKYLGMSKRDTRLLHMTHVSGKVFKGTRWEFREQEGFDPNHLLAKNGNQKVQKGWSLAPQN